ncbi:MAG: UbiA family prenyltransferase [Planctomycetales bacterium]
MSVAFKQKVLPWLQLCRAPALFSAWADVLVGARIARDNWPPTETLIWLIISTSGLYLSGMVFNDVADYQEDLAHRPFRHLPSGRISRRAAWFLAVILMGVGNLAAWFLSSQTGVCAGILSAAILAYDFGPRGNFLAFALMGLCRGLNLLLAVSTGTLPLAWILASALLPWMAAYFLYIFGVTWFARYETTDGKRPFLIGGIACVNLAILLWCGIILYLPRSIVRLGAGMILLWILTRLDIRLWQIARNPTTQHVQSGVRALLMAIIPIHSAWMLIITEDPYLAIGVLLLMVPARFLGRWMTIS